MKTQEHTAGVERATRQILAKFGTVHEHWVSDCAEIIDRETKLPQLLEALERLIAELPTKRDCSTQ